MAGSSSKGQLVAAIADEDTCVGLKLAGALETSPLRGSNYFIVTSQTTAREIELAFRAFCSRPDVAVILIAQKTADQIRLTVDQQVARLAPSVVEVPTKDAPYDPSRDSVLTRAKGMLGSVAETDKPFF